MSLRVYLIKMVNNETKFMYREVAIIYIAVGSFILTKSGEYNFNRTKIPYLLALS